MTAHRTIAVLRADLERSDIGTRSRLADELGGVPILRRTVDRLSVISELAGIFVLCPTAQRDRCRKLLAGTPAVVQDFAGAESPWRRLATVARKWSLDGWRGGIGGATHFDEFLDPPLIDGLLRSEKAEAVLCLPAAAPVFSAELASKMIRHRHGREDELRLVFTQALPGLGGVLLQRSLVAELVARNVPIGTLFAYKPDTPQRDLIFQACCVDLPAPLRFCAGRLVADSDRSTSLLSRLVREIPAPELSTIGPWLLERNSSDAAEFPDEVELELTTDDPYPNSLLRPRGQVLANGGRGERRGPIDLRLIDSIAAELAARDDSRLVLGGFGDPLRHPQFADVLRALRARTNSPFGLAVRTTAVDLDESTMQALIDARVDVLNVLLDAWTPEAYARVHGIVDHGLPPSALQTVPPNAVRAKAALQAVPPMVSNDREQTKLDVRAIRPLATNGDWLAPILDRLARLADLRRAAGALGPLVVPEFCKSMDNIEEMDAFFDGWIRRLGAVNIAGYSHFGDRLPNRSVIDMRPPVRTPCRRIRNRCLILCDGTVALCDQDFRGETAVGRMAESSLAEIWNSPAMQQARNHHQREQWGALPLCTACHEWHRP